MRLKLRLCPLTVYLINLLGAMRDWRVDRLGGFYVSNGSQAPGADRLSGKSPRAVIAQRDLINPLQSCGLGGYRQRGGQVVAPLVR